jgi:hypothetical protein
MGNPTYISTTAGVFDSRRQSEGGRSMLRALRVGKAWGRAPEKLAFFAPPPPRTGDCGGVPMISGLRPRLRPEF